MKKIVVISGSGNKNGIGIKTFKMFKENFDEKEYEFKIIHLTDYNLKTCRGCTICFKKGEEYCPLKDDVSKIVNVIDNSDAIIIISPIYAMNISGSLKTFIDRTSYALHRPRFYNKHAFIITTTDGAGIKHVTMYLKYMLNAYLINFAGSQGVYSYLFKNDEDYKAKLKNELIEKAKKFKFEINRGKEYQPSFMQLARFNAWRIKGIISKDSYLKDSSYWEEKVLLEANYFYPVNLSNFKKNFLKLISKRVEKILSKKIK